MTLLGLGLRLFRLSNQSFWIDEISSLRVAQGPVHGSYERSVLASNSLPTYFLMLKPFVEGIETNLEFRARLLSAIAGSLSVAVFMGVVYLWRRQRGTALLAGALLAVNPLHLWYSQEVRGYAVMLLFGLLTLLFFELAREKRKSSWWVLYTVSATLAMAVHKTGLIFPVACGLWHLREVRQHREKRNSLWAQLPAMIAILVVLALKSYPPPEGYGRSTTGLEVGYTFLTFAGGYSFGPSLTDIQSLGPWAAISNHPIETAILAAVLVALAGIFCGNARALISGKEIQLLALSICVVAVLAIVSGFPYNVRYTLPGLLGFLALAAALSTMANKSLCTRLPVAALLVVSLWSDGQWFYGWDYRKSDARAAAQWLVDHDQIRSWTVLPGYLGVPVEFYLKPYPNLLSREILPKNDQTTDFPPTPDVLMIGRRHHLLQPDRIIASFASAAGEVSTNRAIAGFELYVSAARQQQSGGGK
jgi:hypothetical protein